MTTRKQPSDRVKRVRPEITAPDKVVPLETNKPMPVRFFRKGYEYVRLPKSLGQSGNVEMVIDPNIQFGAPTLRGTRIPLESLAGYVKAGDSVDVLVKSFDVTEAAINAAVDYVNALPMKKEL